MCDPVESEETAELEEVVVAGERGYGRLGCAIEWKREMVDIGDMVWRQCYFRRKD